MRISSSMEFHRPHHTIDETVEEGNEEIAMRLAAERHAKEHRGRQPVRLHVEEDKGLAKEVQKPEEGNLDPLAAQKRMAKFFVCDCGWKTGVDQEMQQAGKKDDYEDAPASAATTYSSGDESSGTTTYGGSGEEEESTKYT